MGKRILLQWAGVGILSLIGWGVDVMPGNISWIPSIIIWSIAFIWLIATILYWLKTKRKKQREDKPSKPAIGGLIGASKGGRVSDSYFKGKITIHGKHKEVDVGSLIGRSENTEVVDSSADAEIEYKQD